MTGKGSYCARMQINSWFMTTIRRREKNLRNNKHVMVKKRRNAALWLTGLIDLITEDEGVCGRESLEPAVNFVKGKKRKLERQRGKTKAFSN